MQRTGPVDEQAPGQGEAARVGVCVAARLRREVEQLHPLGVHGRPVHRPDRVSGPGWPWRSRDDPLEPIGELVARLLAA